MAKKATAIVPTMLRMREELRKRIEREAKKNKRSLNSEMVARLEGSFAKDDAELSASKVLNAVLEHSDGSGKWIDAVAKIWENSRKRIAERPAIDDDEQNKLGDRLPLFTRDKL
jgi:hypothetical protein